MFGVRHITALVISIFIHAVLLGCFVLPEFEQDIHQTIAVRLVQPIAMVEPEIDPVTPALSPPPVFDAPEPIVEEELPVESEPELPSVETDTTAPDISDGDTEAVSIPESTDNGEIGLNNGVDTKIDSSPVESPESGDEIAEEPGPDLDAILDEYRREVRSAILAQRAYPPTARRLGREGKARVQFRVDGNGVVSGAEVELSSGDGSLDNAALDAVSAASPVPPIPSELGVERLTLSILVVFSLE